jgi:hypothetical protein
MGSQVVLLRWTYALLLAPISLGAQQYKADQAGPPPSELAPAIGGALGKAGFAITQDGKTYCEIWLRTSIETVPASKEPDNTLPNITLPQIAVGTLLGAIRFDSPGADRRGQTIQPGVYTLRYGVMPANDDHQGAAPHRDFALLIPAADDRDLSAVPKPDALAAMSRKASGTMHPAILSIWKAASESAGFSQRGDSDWVLEASVGSTPIAIVVAGAADHP